MSRNAGAQNCTFSSIFDPASNYHVHNYIAVARAETELAVLKMSIPSFLPSSFLPYLPRSPTSFHPLSPHDLLAHIAVLRELYLPPIHGGFDASDLHAIDDNAEDEEISEVSRARQRRFSAGLAETIEGLGVGLHLDVGHDTLNKVDEVVEDDLDVLSDDLRDDLSSEDDLDDFEGDDQGHLDPFERDWAEKWLSGLVRRSQGWIEEHEGEESGQDPIDMEQRDVEAVLRDATAVLAMMAGTSGWSWANSLWFCADYSSCRLAYSTLALPCAFHPGSAYQGSADLSRAKPSNVTRDIDLSSISSDFPYITHYAIFPSPRSLYISPGHSSTSELNCAVCKIPS